MPGVAYIYKLAVINATFQKSIYLLMRSVIIYILFLLPLISSAQKFDTTLHSEVREGNIIGQQKSWKENKNEYHFIYYTGNDRGKGINIKETVITNDEGKIVSVQTNGVDNLKSPYSASFSIIGDSGITVLNNVRKAYLYNNGIYTAGSAPGVKQIWLKWLLKQPNLTGFEFPDDTLTAYAPVIYKIPYLDNTITLNFVRQPGYTWLTEDMSLFAISRQNGGIILKGFEPLIDTLFAIQKSLNPNRQKNLANELQRLSVPLYRHMLITNATMFISSKAEVKKNMSVEILEGKVVSFFPSGQKTVLADTIIDAQGKFLMPGLWDMHSHYGTALGLWYMAGGVTHVRDMKTTNLIQEDQRSIRANELIGPDISYTSGLIDREDPVKSAGGKSVTTLEKAIAAMDEYHRLGYDQVKFYSSLKPEWIKPMADHAHSLGMRVAGHVPAYMNAEQAIHAGYNEINHMNQIFLSFLGADTLATDGLLRLRVPGALAGTIDLSSKKVQSFIQLMKRKFIVVDPTLRIQESFYTEFKGDTSKMNKPVLKWMANTSDLAKTNNIPLEEEKPAYLASFKNMMKMVKLLFDNGILLVAGTDGGSAIALHRELEIYNEAGIPANEVLKIATYNAAKDCGLENEYGQIAAGKSADFILIDGNPTKNISDIRRVEWVIKNGRMYSPKKLLASRGWKYYY